ncbi:unnamed protein product [Prorocentrum cordatum]|uniref:Phosphatidic acid phosphatase type 2/haloperoxidase domain-containing protein n=1 Tax=Prorocentrum cordatum TaxID=2364126 RepID=A0ABN9Y7J0_9DINO|nr:unnamed protein product [Polarella glacialis]
MASGTCSPQWHVDGRSCPYGTKVALLGASLTWPNSDQTFLVYLAAFYSTVPFGMGVGFLLLLLWRRGTRELLALALLVLQSGILLLLKLAFGQPRPVGSCLTSCGMPSGHTMCTITFLTWFAWEALPGHPAFLGASACVLLPVGWSRTVLRDHTWQQVAAGSVFGILMGCAWHAALKQRSTGRLLDWLVGRVPVLRHSYPSRRTSREDTGP